MELEQEDMMEAVSDGVRLGIIELGTSHGRFDVPHELMFEAIRQGVADAIWRVATNATDAPCKDFYDTIKEGVTAGVARLDIKGLMSL